MFLPRETWRHNAWFFLQTDIGNPRLDYREYSRNLAVKCTEFESPWGSCKVFQIPYGGMVWKPQKERCLGVGKPTHEVFGRKGFLLGMGGNKLLQLWIKICCQCILVITVFIKSFKASIWETFWAKSTWSEHSVYLLDRILHWTSFPKITRTVTSQLKHPGSHIHCEVPNFTYVSVLCKSLRAQYS